MSQASEIYVLDKKVRLLQPEEGFRTGLDSVMLAAACPVKAGQSVLDMGCGVGGASFCVLARMPECHVTGVEVQDCHVKLAQDNTALNKAEGRAEFICSDIRDFKTEICFDHVICNPPYLEAGEYVPSSQEKKAKALGHLDPELSVQEWIDCGFRLVKSRGSLSIIHRADAVDRIIRAMGKRFGGIEIIPLWPHAGQPAKRVIVRALKDRHTPAKIHSGVVLHEQDGNSTSEAKAILCGKSCM